MALMYLDELNNLTTELEASDIKTKSKQEVMDLIEYLLLFAYATGKVYAEEQIDAEISIGTDRVDEVINEPIAGKTFRQRVSEYYDKGDVKSIIKVADTESHRVHNVAEMDVAKASGKNLIKTWKTMEDDRVRETHEFLQGVSVGINEKFYTFDGDSADAPGGFSNPDNVINCRCYLDFSLATS